MAVRRAAHAAGLRFRLHVSNLPGKPDLVFHRWKVAMFVNGCFWHSHPNCSRARIPKSNNEYWTAKLSRNRERDLRNIKNLRADGWRCVVIWECQTKHYERLKRMIFRRITQS
jgi:DNA mismatch endonuclease (patch repair protein)